jgi:glycosyltransferase involved in cell wall biosynthesis
MKILQLNFEKGWRGGERQTLYCMRAFRAAGHEVEILCRAGAPLAARAAEDGFVVHAVRHVPAQLAYLTRAGRRYDIIHAQTANTVTWAVLTKAFHRRPVVFSRRTSFEVKPEDTWKTAAKWRRVDGFVAISDMAAIEPRRLGLNPVIIRSAVEPHTTNEQNVAQLVSEFHLQGKKVLATSAALIRDKDPVTLVRAIGELARTRHDFVFIHFGAGGDREAQARAEVAALGLESVYLFAGFRKGVEDFYAIFDVFVMSSIEEALGSSVLDAFLQHVPVVSTDAGGLKESLAEGRGVLCAVGDAHAMAAGMTRCLDDVAFREDCTQRAYHYVRTEHDVTEMGRRYLTLFEQLLSKASQR